MQRGSMSSSLSKELFSRTAQATHPLNLRLSPMRGGYRI